LYNISLFISVLLVFHCIDIRNRDKAVFKNILWWGGVQNLYIHIIYIYMEYSLDLGFDINWLKIRHKKIKLNFIKIIR